MILNKTRLGPVASVFAIAVLSCDQQPDVSPKVESGVPESGTTQHSLTALIDSLGALPGEFVLSGLVWDFQGDTQMMNAIAAKGDSAVAALVDCLGNDQLARATVEGRRVPMGVMCYTTLQRTAYPLEPEDGDGSWPGFVEPTASVEELKKAQEAWRAVVADKAYRLS